MHAAIEESRGFDGHTEASSAEATGNSSAYAAAIETLHGHGPSLRDGLFGHAPMVVEALVELGAPGRIPAWLDTQADSFTPRPAPVASIDGAEWRTLLGQRDRFADWSRFFAGAFESEGWRLTLDRWVERLAPGFTTAACHGVIRTAHAVRALGRSEDALVQRELADALASWASMYLPLPFEAKPAIGGLDPAMALERLSPVPSDHRPGEGMIVAGYFALLHCERFRDDVAAVDLRGDVNERVDDLVTLFSELFVRRAHTPFLAIVFAHAVSGAAAVAHIAKEVGEETARTLLFRAWEAGCALESAFGSEGSGAPPTYELDPEALRVAAIAQTDDHVIKLTEVCLSTWNRRQEPTLLDAAAHIQRLL